MNDLFNQPEEQDPFEVEAMRDMVKRKANGTYGICRVSGRPIDRRWLALVPYATVNVDFDKYIETRRAWNLPITDQMRELQKQQP